MTTATTTEYNVKYFASIFAPLPDIDAARKTYRELAIKFHPDRNPALGQEPMKALNEAYEQKLKHLDGKSYQAYNATTNAHEERTYKYEGDFERWVMDIIQYAINLRACETEICGLWLWVSGDKDTTKALQKPKEEGAEDTRPYWLDASGESEIRFQWSKAQKRWYLDFRQYLTGATQKSRRHSKWTMDDIRSRHGSVKLKDEEKATSGRR